MIIPSILLAKCWDRIRLIAIKNMKGAFGNEGALRFYNLSGESALCRRWPILGNRRLKLRLFVQQRQNFFYQCIGGDAVFLPQDWNRAMLDELIRPAYAHHRRVDHLRVQMFHDRAAETVVQNMIFDRAHDFDTAREKFERAGIHRFDPSRIDERDGNSFLLQFAGGFLGHFKHVAKPEYCHVAPMLHDFRLADLEQLGFWFDFCAWPRPSRITNGNWAGVVVRHGPKHIDELVLILRLHVPPIGDVAKVPNVEQTVMRWAVVAA